MQTADTQPWHTRLQERPAWRELPTSSFARQWALKGAWWELKAVPPCQWVKQDYYPQKEATRRALQTELQELLANGRISTYADHLRRNPLGPDSDYFIIQLREGDAWRRVKVPLRKRPHFISAMGMVRKKGTTKLRPIVNLSEQNQYCLPVTFRIQTWESIYAKLLPGTWMATLDCENGFHHIPLKWEYRNLIGISFEGTDYVYNVLPFGHHAAPYIFTTALAPAVKEARKLGLDLMVYIDDILLLVPPEQGRPQAMEAVCDKVKTLLLTLNRFGWRVNFKKSRLTPTQAIDFLGFHISCAPQLRYAKLHVADEKRDSISRLLQTCKARSSITAIKLAMLLGKLNFQTRVVWMGPLFMRGMFRLLAKKKSWFSRLSIDQEAYDEMEWWLHQLGQDQGKEIRCGLPQVALTTDASETGWGGWISDHPLVMQEPHRQSWEPLVLNKHEIAHGRFDNYTSTNSSNFRELTAVTQALMSFREQVRGRRVLLRSDNSTTVACTNRWTTTSTNLAGKVEELMQLTQQLDITVTAIHLPGDQNGLADKLSRLIDSADWKLNEEVFTELDQEWGPITIDRFASAMNCMVERFNSMAADPRAEAIDALSQDWKWHPRTGEREVNWANPPFHKLDEVVQLILRQRADTILITPAWKGERWFQALHDSDFQRVLLPNVSSLFRAFGAQHEDEGFFRPPQWQTLAWRIFF
jgi:hypothetical protein